MDISTFYALFSATCFTLLGLWWNVLQLNTAWVGVEDERRAVGGVYLTFLLPALMGLFAQVGGTETPAIWRVSFVGEGDERVRVLHFQETHAGDRSHVGEHGVDHPAERSRELDDRWRTRHWAEHVGRHRSGVDLVLAGARLRETRHRLTAATVAAQRAHVSLVGAVCLREG